MSRLVCQFSCGAASAVATKLVLMEEQPQPVIIVNAFVKEEHPDNVRFLLDCERWFGQLVTCVRDEKYGASTFEVWRRRRFMKGQRGAPCSLALKKDVLAQFARPGDTMILGFTLEEQDRFDKWLDTNPWHGRAPLIERELSKADVLAMVERAGLRLPAMYALGFNNANCIGCVKGGEGYWNHVRRVFPEQFIAIADLQASIGRGAALFRNRKSGERFMLHELDPEAGRHDELLPDCSFYCEAAEEAMIPPPAGGPSGITPEGLK